MGFYKEKGTIALIGKVVSGETERGSVWARQDIVIDVPIGPSSFKKICVTAGSDKIEDVAKLNIGDEVEVTFTVTAREWNGRWYNNVTLVDITAEAMIPAEVQPKAKAQGATKAAVALEDDLPFL